VTVGRRREAAMVPDAEFTSYYGTPMLHQPTWQAPAIAGYLFLGGLAGGSSLVAAGAQLTGRAGLARAAKLGSTTAAGLALVALVHDLGRPARFANMLRVFKPTSPMSIGSWLLTAYVPASVAATALDLSGRLRVAGVVATGAAAVLAPGVASYTGALISDTAVPAWHDGHREMPYLFVASAAASAAGWGLLVGPASERAPVRRLAIVGAVSELASSELMVRRMGMVGGAYRTGRAGGYRRAALGLLAGGALAALAARRQGGALARVAGAALLAGSASTRFAVFEAGRASAADPRYTVVPQRERLDAQTERPVESSMPARSQ
jgi:hypothetical protein